MTLLKPKRVCAVLFSLLLCGAAATAPLAGLKSGVFDPPRVAPEIALQATDGRPFTLAKFRGKLVVLEFGYTHCADVCPVSLASLTQARQQLGAAAADMQVLFITVDPARDDAVRLSTYLAAFDPSFIGLTGSAAQVDAVLKAYGISATKKMIEGSKTAYTMHHSSYLYFVDRQGLLRALMPFGRPASEIVHDARLFLKR